MWFNIDEDAGSISDRNHNYMGAACTKGFGSALSGANMENARKNKTIRDKNGHSGHTNANDHNNKDGQQIYIKSCYRRAQGGE